MKRYDLSTCIVLDPGLDSAPAIVVYGGLRGWQGAWLINRIPSDMLQSAFFIMPYQFTADCNVCLKEFRGKADTSKVSSYSLCGYSRGATPVYQYFKIEEFKLIGLIDPGSPDLNDPKYDDTVLDSVATKIRCVYWVPNWGKGGYGGRIPDFAQHLRDLKVKMTEKAVEHEDMPNFFFKTYGMDFKS